MSPIPKPAGRETVMEEPREVGKEAAEVRDTFVTLFSHGVDRLADVQKRAIDLAVQQNAEIIDIYKKFGMKVPGTARVPLLEVASTVFERYAETQKHAIDVAVEQSHAWMNALKERTTAVNKAAESAVNLTNQVVERSIAAQKKVVENTVAQTKAAMEATRHQMGFTGEQADAVANSFQRGVDSFVEAQKEMLDLVAR